MAEVVATESALDKFRNIVADFNTRYALLSSNTYGAKIARTNDSALMQEYGNTLAKMRTVKSTIDYTMNAYQGLKSFIGLGAIPLIPIAIIAAITITVTAAVKTIDSFMKRAGIKELQEENPTMSLVEASNIYDRQHQSQFGRAIDLVQIALLVGGAFLLYNLFSKR